VKWTWLFQKPATMADNEQSSTSAPAGMATVSPADGGDQPISDQNDPIIERGGVG
jgi:hypothetical protein